LFVNFNHSFLVKVLLTVLLQLIFEEGDLPNGAVLVHKLQDFFDRRVGRLKNSYVYLLIDSRYIRRDDRGKVISSIAEFIAGIIYVGIGTIGDGTKARHLTHLDGAQKLHKGVSHSGNVFI
jgi:hypothetical protein